MAKCNLCGAKIRAYFDICVGCSNRMEASLGGFDENIVKTQFIRDMGINV